MANIEITGQVDDSGRFDARLTGLPDWSSDLKTISKILETTLAAQVGAGTVKDLLERLNNPKPRPDSQEETKARDARRKHEGKQEDTNTTQTEIFDNLQKGIEYGNVLNKQQISDAMEAARQLGVPLEENVKTAHGLRKAVDQQIDMMRDKGDDRKILKELKKLSSVLAESSKNYAKTIDFKIPESTEDATRMLGSAMQGLGGITKDLASGDRGSFDSLSGKLQATFVKFTSIDGALSLFGATVMTATRLMKEFGGNVSELHDTGITFLAGTSGSIREIGEAATEAGFRVSTMSTAWLKFSTETILLGPKAFANFARAGLDATIKMGYLGLTVDEMNEYMGDYLETQRYAGLLQGRTDADRGRSFSEYIEQITMLARVTGVHRKQIADTIKETMKAPSVGVLLASMAEDERERVSGAFADLSAAISASGPAISSLFENAGPDMALLEQGRLLQSTIYQDMMIYSPQMANVYESMLTNVLAGERGAGLYLEQMDQFLKVGKGVTESGRAAMLYHSNVAESMAELSNAVVAVDNMMGGLTGQFAKSLGLYDRHLAARSAMDNAFERISASLVNAFLPAIELAADAMEYFASGAESVADGFEFMFGGESSWAKTIGVTVLGVAAMIPVFKLLKFGAGLFMKALGLMTTRLGASGVVATVMQRIPAGLTGGGRFATTEQIAAAKKAGAAASVGKGVPTGSLKWMNILKGAVRGFAGAAIGAVIFSGVILAIGKAIEWGGAGIKSIGEGFTLMASAMTSLTKVDWSAIDTTKMRDIFSVLSKNLPNLTILEDSLSLIKSIGEGYVITAEAMTSLTKVKWSAIDVTKMKDVFSALNEDSTAIANLEKELSLSVNVDFTKNENALNRVTTALTELVTAIKDNNLLGADSDEELIDNLKRLTIYTDKNSRVLKQIRDNIG